MLVSEIFYSLQGEGPRVGEPSVFIRLGGCIEPYCPWCDTAYALHEYAEMGIPEIIREAISYACREVVITGGEPFLQWETGLRSLHEELSSMGFRLSYETSGKAGIPELQETCIILSPKNIRGEWLIDRGILGRASYFKFVAEDSASLKEIDAFVQGNALSGKKVYIMPMGGTRNEQIQRMEMVFCFCRDRGYNMTPRLHVLSFDTRRGV